MEQCIVKINDDEKILIPAEIKNKLKLKSGDTIHIYLDLEQKNTELDELYEILIHDGIILDPVI